MRERDGRDDAQHAVEDEQEQRDDREARDARLEALVERLLAERGRDLGARDQVELQRQGAGLEHLREVLGGRDREAAGDLRAGRAVDAVGVLAVVDERDRDELVVERDREVVRALLRVRVERVGVVGAALGDLAGDLLERLLALVGEVEGDDRLVAAALVEVLLGVLDVRAREPGVVADDPEAVGRRAPWREAFSSRRTSTPGLDLEHLGARLLGVVEALERRRARLVGQAVVERLLGDLVEGVEARRGRGLAVLRHRDLALGRPLDRVVEAGDGLLAAVDLGRRWSCSSRRGRSSPSRRRRAGRSSRPAWRRARRP